jgi:hypothetical protein
MGTSAILLEDSGSTKSQALTQLAFAYAVVALVLQESFPADLIAFVLDGSLTRFVTAGILIGAFLVLVDPVDHLFRRYLPLHRHRPFSRIQSRDQWTERLLPHIERIHKGREDARAFSPKLLDDTRKRAYDSPYVKDFRSRIVAEWYLGAIFVALLSTPLTMGITDALGLQLSIVGSLLLFLGLVLVIAALWWDIGELRDRMNVVAVFEMLILLGIPIQHNHLRVLMSQGYWSEAESWIENGTGRWLHAMD